MGVWPPPALSASRRALAAAPHSTQGRALQVRALNREWALNRVGKVRASSCHLHKSDHYLLPTVFGSDHVTLVPRPLVDSGIASQSSEEFGKDVL